MQHFNGDRLRSARVYNNKTISELSESIGVSKQAISQYENNKSVPSFEVLLRIVNDLGFPREYFYEEDKEKVKIGNTYFRALLTTNKRDRRSQIEKIKLLGQIYCFLDRYIEFPDLNIPSLDCDADDIEKIALDLREYWNLGCEPIPNMVRLLERNGIIVTSLKTKNGFIDAFSQRQQINKKDYYIVVLSDNKNSAARRQFDCAHELGHIILHDWSLDLGDISREEFRQMENEANQFAAALLLPKEGFRKDLFYPTDLEYYVELKKKWKVSISAMIVRAHQLKVINYNQYQYLMRQLSKKGWRTREPLDDVIQVPEPIILKKAIQILIDNKVLTGGQILQELSNYGLTLNREKVEILLGLTEGTLIDKETMAPVINIKKNIN